MKKIEIQKIIQELFSFAVPMSISSLVVALASLINARIMIANKIDVYIYAIVTPVSYFIIAFQESLRVATIMIFSNQRLIQNIQMMLLKLLFIAILLGSFFFILLNIFNTAIAKILHVDQSYLNTFKVFLSQIAAVSFSLLSALVVLNAFLVGLGFKGAAFTFNVMNSTITSVSLYLLIHFCDMNIYGMVVAMEISAVFLLAAIGYFLFKKKIFKNYHCKINKSDFKIIFRTINKISLPLFISYLALFGGLIAYNSILSNYNLDILTGYYISYRLQTFIIFPAISIGCAMAILINKIEPGLAGKKWNIIVTGFFITFIIYELLGLMMYYFRDNIVHLIVSSEQIKESAVNYIKYASPSYGVFGSVVSLATMLEQTGYGYVILVFNIIFFSIIFFIGKYLLFTHHSYISFYQIIGYSNYFTGVLIVSTFLLYKKRFI